MTGSELFLPPEWADDQKMSVMFAPFRDKSLNPQSWDRKLKFWIHVISEDCRKNNRFIIDIKDLQTRFVRNGKKPGCFDVVLAEMQRSGKLLKVSHYQKGVSSSWVGWGFQTFVRTPVSWGLNAIWGQTNNNNNTEPLILFEVLKGKCEELLQRHYTTVEHESTDNVVELQSLRARHKEMCSTEQEFDLVLQKLQQDQKVIMTQTLERDVVVKFCKKEDKNVASVTELELNIFRIQKVEKNLEKQTEVLSHQCDKLAQEAKCYVKEGKRTLALQSLRKKKRVERTLNQKMASMDQLHNMMMKIQDAATNDMILKAYNSGMNAIKSLNEETPSDKVENVMDKLQDALEDQGEVTQLLSQDLSSSDTSQDDLEKELSDLLIADQRATEAGCDDLSDLMEGLAVHETLPSLPDVPSFSPSKASQLPEKPDQSKHSGVTGPYPSALTH